MNREDIIRMAQDAGFLPQANPVTPQLLERFAALVASAEREACAEVCKKHADVYAKLEQNPTAQSAWAACIDNRDAIRARGNVATNDTSQERVDKTSESVHEPVAWIYSQGTAKVASMNYVSGVRATPLYTSPPAQRTWVGLTDGEIEVIEALKAPPVHPDFIDCDDWMEFARAIEYKLKGKNT